MGEESKPAFGKGDRAAIVGGRKNVGVRGQVFWIGEDKYGPGQRYGLRGDDGETYWVTGANIGPEEGAPPAPELGAPRETLSKGGRVSITKGPAAGVEGEIFWIGASKFGAGSRYGIKDAEGETHWADDSQVELLRAPAVSPDAVRAEPGAPPPFEEAPFPEGLPEGEDDFAEPASGFEDDVPFPGDDLPF